MDSIELRLKLLEHAKDILSDRVWVERNRLEQDWNAQVNKFGQINNTSSIKFEMPKFPELPSATHNDVIAVAAELEKYIVNGKV